MADENKKPEPKKDVERIKKLEAELKTAFKEEHFEDVKKLGTELKKIDPENHLANRLLEKVEKASANKSRRENLEKVTALEKQMKEAFSAGRLMDIAKIAGDIKKIEPENKAVKKMEVRIDKAKASADTQVKKDKIKVISSVIKELLKNEKWDDAAKKANEILELDFKNGYALKTLKKVAKIKNVEVKTLVTVTPPKPAEPAPSKAEGSEAEKKEEKKGLFGKLFKKKEEEAEPAKAETEEKKPETPAKAEAKPATPAAPVTPAPKPATPAAPVTPATPPAEAPKPATPVKTPAPKTGVIKPIVPSAGPSAMPPKTLGAKPVPVKPVVPPKAPTKVTPMVAVPLGTTQKPGTKAPLAGKEKGNIFTNLFGKKAEGEKPTESIIETIVAQTDQTKKVKREVKKKMDDIGEGFLRFANIFLRFSIAFIVISAAFFYAFNIDEENRVLALFGEENNALKLKNTATELDEVKKEEKKVTREIEKYKKGYENEYKDTILYIIDNRMDWSDLIKKLNEVTESVYEKNALAQYVKYNNYSYDVKTGQLAVSATLSDPMGKNLTKLAELEEAFTYYPKDKNDPNDKSKPYFYDLKGFSSYAKAFNPATGRYTSSFSLSLSTKEKEKK
jgi:hypothetical protein